VYQFIDFLIECNARSYMDLPTKERKSPYHDHGFEVTFSLPLDGPGSFAEDPVVGY